MKLKTKNQQSLLDSSLHNGTPVSEKKKKTKRKSEEGDSSLINNHTEDVETPIKKRKKTKIKEDQSSQLAADNTVLTNGVSVPDHESVTPKKKEKKDEKTSETALVEMKENLPQENGNHETSESKPSEEDGEKSSDEEDTTVKLSNKEVNEITAKYLRTSFNTASGISILRKFVTICTENKDRDLASEYIEKSGNVLEILRLLEGGDKKNLNNAALVFQAMHIVIMKILEKYPQNIPAAQEACHNFINSHLSTVHLMMSSQSSPKQRKIVLRLLASIVSLGDTLPRELLAHLSFHPETLLFLAQQTKPTDPQNVRICFIHLILAFLVDARISVIRALLDKRGLLSSIFPELIYDSHATVSLVLNTVKTYVLENSGINKTSKLHVFSTPVVQSLVSLYNWKGPRNWPGMKTKKRKAFSESVDLQDKEIAVEAVHDFLLVLLTSNRHGIIFSDKSLGTTGKKHNQLVNTILQSLERPWDHEKPRDLVSKILAVCPDLIKPQLTYTEPFLEPRPSKKWIGAMDFVKKILSSVEPEICLKSSLPELTSGQLVNATLTLTMPSIVLKKAVVPSIDASNIILRYEAATMLTVMLKQAQRFLTVAKDNVTRNEYSNLESNVRDYISKNIPSIETILKAWNRIDEPTETIEINVEEIQLAPMQVDYFSAILDLLQVYHDVHPQGLESENLGALEQDPQSLLTSLNGLEDVDEDKLNIMKIKAIQTIQILKPQAFAPDDKFLGKSLLFLITLLENSSDELSTDGKKTMKILLEKSKVFEGCEEQMDIWLNCFSLLENSQEKIDVAQWFVKNIPKAVKRVDKYRESILEIEKLQEAKSKSTPKPKTALEENTMKLMQPQTAIPAILCAAFESLKKTPNESAGKYIAFITIFTLHCQVSPKALIALSQDIQDLQGKYLNSWLEESSPIPLKKILTKNIIGRFSKILLSTDEINIDQILNGENGVKSSYELLNLLKMTLFYLTQFIHRKKITQDEFNRYKIVIIGLLDHSRNFKEEKDLNCVLKVSKQILTHPTFLKHLSPIPKNKNDVGDIVTTGLVEIFEKIVEINEESYLQDLFLPFRNKIMSQMRIVLKKCAGGWALGQSQCLLEFLEILQLTAIDFQELLRKIITLPKESFLSEDKKQLSMWGQVTPKILELLSKKKDGEVIKEPAKEAQVIHKLCVLFQHLNSTEANVEIWENSLLKFFKTFPHHISTVDPPTFNSLLENKIDQSTIGLVSFLTSRNSKLIPLFVKHISTEDSKIKHHELVFPVLSSNLSYKWCPNFLAKICKQYEKDIINYFSFTGESASWISQNTKAIKYLIKTCFTLDTCENITTKILSSGDKLETVDLNYTTLLHTLFTKLSELNPNPQEILTQFIQVLLRIIVSSLKKNAKDEERVEILCRYICETIGKLKQSEKTFTYEELNKSYVWPQFTRFSLKLGLKSSKKEIKILPLLKTLSEACDIAYGDKSGNEYVKTLFEMTTSHSEFVNIMLSTQEVKRDLLRLLYILIRKEPTVMTSSHIPLYLSAYNGTLSQSDQQILMILHHYESSGIKLTEYRPYLFGEAAAAHYSVRTGTDTAIWRQPTTSQVLELLNMEIVNNTINNYPVNRKLMPDELHPGESVYDPAFYLPLLTHLLADNNVIACHKVTQTGALALVFAACGSASEEIRMTAFTVISRFYFHLEATSSKEKLLWMRIIDALRNGIASLESPLFNVRLNCFVSTFLAKTTLIATQPLNQLYAPLQKFFMCKPELDLKIIPEFLTLFNSSEINHKVHRHWILEVVRDGLKTDVDMEIASKCFLFRTLFYFYGSILADAPTKVLILQVVAAAVKIPKAALLLCRNYGLLAWLGDVASKVSFRDIESIRLIVNITRDLLDIVLKNNDHENHIQFMLLDVSKSLISKLSKNTSVSCYLKLLTSINDTLRNKSYCEVIHKNEIENLIEVSKNIVGDVSDCTEILVHKCEFVERKDVPEDNDEVVKAKFYLRTIVIAWRSHVKS